MSMQKILLALTAVAALGWYLRPGPALPTERLAGEELVATISHGEAVDLDEHTADGRFTLFEYTADW